MPIWVQLLAWPLRKAAIIPAVAVGVGVVAAAVGAADLAASFTRAVAPTAEYAKSAETLAAEVNAARAAKRAAHAEAARLRAAAGDTTALDDDGGDDGAPVAVTVPQRRTGSTLVAGTAAVLAAGSVTAAREWMWAPRTAPLRVRLANASATVAHAFRTYPYRFRGVSVLLAGALAGSTYVLMDIEYNRATESERDGGSRIAMPKPKPKPVLAPVLASAPVPAPAAATDLAAAAAAIADGAAAVPITHGGISHEQLEAEAEEAAEECDLDSTVAQ